VKRLLVISLVLGALVSCTGDKYFSYEQRDPAGNADHWAQKTRVESPETRSVMILYSAGFNTLADFLDANIVELEQGFIPERKTRADHILLVYSKLTRRNSRGECVADFSTPTESALFRMYRKDGEVVKDTLRIWGTDVNASDPQTLREVCQMAYDLYPANSYGMVFTSHASGWLPAGYYNDPSAFEPGTVWKASVGGRNQRSYPAIDPYPAVKSFGQDNNPGNPVEMDLDQFVDAIPFKLDYLLIDACLSGCVEVAYQLRGKADIVGFSQTEVLAAGFDYVSITSRLLQATPDPVQVCTDYYNRYLAEPNNSRYATISAVDTRKLEPLAAVCKTLFQKYRTQMETMDADYVQGYFRHDRHFFYDLKDILVKAGITEEETAQLQDALDQCVLYKAATDYFISIRIRYACGLSMYLPQKGSDFLDAFYKEHLDWNKATELVQ
jgi:hypothetical protein